MCGVEMITKQHMKNHVEGKHINWVSHPCILCGKAFETRQSLSMHNLNNHKVQPFGQLNDSISEDPDTTDLDFVNMSENTYRTPNASVNKPKRLAGHVTDQ